MFRRVTGASVALSLALVFGLAACGDAEETEPPAESSLTETDAGAGDESAAPEDEATDGEATDEADAGDETDTAEGDETDTAEGEDGEEAEEEAPAIPASANLDGIEVAGDAGAKPTVTVPFPWAINRSQNKVLDKGDGPLVLPGDVVRVNYLGVDGRTGEVFDNSYDSGAPVSFSLNGVVTGFAKGLTGQNVGSRILMAMPSDDGYGDSGNGDTIEGGDSLVFVAEIVSTSRRAVSGAVAEIPAGLPLVTGDIKPEVTLPANPKLPDDLQVVTLIEGDGEAIVDGGYAQVQYIEYAWSGETLTFIRQTYGQGTGPIYSYLGSAVPAWNTALAGVKEGSRVLIVSPPDQAYPTGNKKLGVAEGDYSVWVVDVLFA
jgi:peptidylprolyl isomerase